MDVIMPLAILAVIGTVMALLYWRKPNRPSEDDNISGFDDSDYGGDGD